MQARFWIAALLAAVGGYVDVICLIRYSTFVATMTGNLVMTGQTFYEVVHHVVGPAEPTRIHHPLVKQHISAVEAGYLVTFRAAVMIMNCFGAFCYELLHRRFPDSTAKTAAPFLAFLAVLPDLARAHSSGAAEDRHDDTWWVSLWSALSLAFALGFTHFMCSPGATDSRMKNVVMASTGHMHKVSKLLHKRSTGDVLKSSDWEAMALSTLITFSMAFGAVLGAAALHLNPFSEDTDDGLLVPVAISLLIGLWAHDAFIEPPGGWPRLASEPLIANAA